MYLTLGCKKCGSSFRLRIVQHIGRYAFFADHAVAHDDDSGRDLSYDVDVVRDKKERCMLLSVDVGYEL